MFWALAQHLLKMKRFILTCLAALLPLMFSFAGNDGNDDEERVIILEGSYQERNVYVINSVSSAGVGYCTYEVRVNGEVTTDNINSSAFEIDLTQYQFAVGSPIFIEIRYREGCSPKVVNPNVILPKPSFHCESVELQSDGLLKWKTTNEQGALPFIVQQFKWSKWINVGEVQGKGTAGPNDYNFQLDLVSGQNKVRVIQKGFNGEKLVSPVGAAESEITRVSWDYDRRGQTVNFSRETAYELYDRFGRLKKRGFGQAMDVSNMEAESYWLSYDSMTDPFEKRGEQ